MKLVALVTALSLATGACGSAQKGLTNKQVAIGIGAVAIIAVIIYAASQSHCEANDCTNF